jgi:hypothetical protein
VPDQIRRILRPSVGLDVAVVAVSTLAIFIGWAATDGGYAEVVWYPAAVLLLVLGLVLTWARRGRALGYVSLTAVSALGTYAGWGYLSLLWAGDRGVALEGANRTLMYLLVFVVVLGRRWSWSQAVAYASLWASAVVVVGVVVLVHAAYAAHPENSFTGGRLDGPIDYANANAALFVLAAWPLLVVACSPSVPAVLRTLALPTAGVAVEVALLAQSKGGAIATAVTLALLVVVARRRVRVLCPLVLVGATVALFHGPLLGVYDRVSNGDHPGGAIRAALAAMLASFALLAVAAVVALVAERGLERLGRAQGRIVNAVAGGLVILAALAAVAAIIHRYGDPTSLASRTWHAFKYPPRRTAAASHFLTGAGNHRYDLWRVAAEQVNAAPLVGKGAENFAVDYVRRRQSTEEPLYPHSLEASLFGGTGVVGFALFAIFVGAAGLICLRATRSRLPGRSTAGLAVFAMATYWFAHSSVDWLWEFPALTGPALAVVACLDSCEGLERRAARVRGRPLVIGAAALFAAVALVPAWLAARETSLGAHEWRTETAQAFADLDSAARLNRLSDQAYVIAGTIAERRRTWQLAERYFSLALRRNRSNWYSHLERGIALAKTGRHDAALAELVEAQRLDPREPIIRIVLADLRAGRRVEVAPLDSAMLKRTEVPKGH